jgi:hypothetical protein
MRTYAIFAESITWTKPENRRIRTHLLVRWQTIHYGSDGGGKTLPQLRVSNSNPSTLVGRFVLPRVGES